MPNYQIKSNLFLITSEKKWEKPYAGLSPINLTIHYGKQLAFHNAEERVFRGVCQIQTGHRKVTQCQKGIAI